MDLIDLLRAIPGLVVVGLLPGIALVSLIHPSMPGSWRLAMAPGLSCGAVGTLGLLYHDAHVAFELGTAMPPLVVLAVAALVRALTGRSAAPDPHRVLRSRPAVLVLTGGLIAGLISAGIVVSALRVAPLPIAGDAPIHGAVTNAIAARADVLPSIPVPATKSAVVRPRSAFEATSALVAELGGMRPVSAMVPLALLAVVLLPLSLAVLMFETSSSWVMAAAVPLLGVGMTLATFAVRFGEYPYLVDATLVVPMVVGGRRILLGRNVRAEAGLLVAVVAAVWVLHGLELLTAVVVGLPLALASIRGIAWRDLVRRVAVLWGAFAAGALIVTVMTRLPSEPPPMLPPAVHVASQASIFLGVWGSGRQAPLAFANFISGELAGVVPALAYLLGVIVAVRVRGMRWALASHVLMLLLLADVGYSVLLGRLWTAVFPWAVVDRLVSIQWFVVPLLMCWGLFRVRDAFPLAADDRRRPATRVIVSLIAGCALLTPVVGAAEQLSGIRDAVAASGGAGDADWTVLTAMDRTLVPGTVVLTRGAIDAGVWVDAVTRDVEWAPLTFSRGLLDSGAIPLADARARDLALACTDQGRARAALQGIGAIYMSATLPVGSSMAWDPRCIAALPGVHLALAAGDGHTTARLYTVSAQMALREGGCKDRSPCR